MRRKVVKMALNDKHVLLIGVLIFSIAIAGSLVFGEKVEKSSEIDGGTLDWSDDFKRNPVQMGQQGGYAEEGTGSEAGFEIPETNVRIVNFTLTWHDEADANMRYSNKPDTFTIAVESPDGTFSDEASGTNAHGEEGVIDLSIEMIGETDTPTKKPYSDGTGKWHVMISVNAGEQVFWRPSARDQDQPDNGNDFSLDIEYEYYDLMGEGEESRGV